VVLVHNHDEDVERFEQLLERSSLGSPGARELRRRTPRAHVEVARRIYQLRSRMMHGQGLEGEALQDRVEAAVELIDLLTELGYHGQADHLLHEAFPRGQGATIARAAAFLTLHQQDLGVQNPPRRRRRRSAEGRRQPSRSSSSSSTIASLTLAPSSDRFPASDPRWEREMHALFVGLREHLGAVPLIKPTSPPVDDGHIVLVVMFRHSPAAVTNLSQCLRSWLDQEPGRRLSLIADATGWDQRIVLESGGTWSLTGTPAPADDA
jgi:hypothetical protein